MRNPTEPLQAVRRHPQQDRSRRTKDAIFTAAIQVLESRGEEHFNTNSVAERAGVSVGTLYQYFSRKEEILIELAMQETQRLRDFNQSQRRGNAQPEDAIRESIRLYIGLMRDHPTTRRAALKAIRAEATQDQLGKSADKTSASLPFVEGMSASDHFILSRSVMGAVQSAVLEDYEGLYRPEFEDKLVRMVQLYLSSMAEDPAKATSDANPANFGKE